MLSFLFLMFLWYFSFSLFVVFLFFFFVFLDNTYRLEINKVDTRGIKYHKKIKFTAHPVMDELIHELEFVIEALKCFTDSEILYLELNKPESLSPLSPILYNLSRFLFSPQTFMSFSPSFSSSSSSSSVPSTAATTTTTTLFDHPLFVAFNSLFNEHKESFHFIPEMEEEEDDVEELDEFYDQTYKDYLDVYQAFSPFPKSYCPDSDPFASSSSSLSFSSSIPVSLSSSNISRACSSTDFSLQTDPDPNISPNTSLIPAIPVMVVSTVTETETMTIVPDELYEISLDHNE